MTKKRKGDRAIEGHIYLHSKSQNQYVVLARTTNDVGEADILYTRADECFGEMLYTQKERRFLETVKINHEKVPRMTYVGPHADVLVIRKLFNQLTLQWVRNDPERQKNPRTGTPQKAAAS